MTIRCQCNALSDQDFERAIEANREKIADMCLTKATAFIFKAARDARPISAPKTLHKCPRPCYSVIQSLINEAESAPPASCKGYASPSGCAAADVLRGMLLEM